MICMWPLPSLGTRRAWPCPHSVTSAGTGEPWKASSRKAVSMLPELTAAVPADRWASRAAPPSSILGGSRCRVVDQRGDLRELDACRGAVEALDAFGELRREECPRCLLGFPEIDVSRAPVLVVDGECLRPKPRHPGKSAFRLLGDPVNTLAVEALGVLERHEHSDHAQLLVRRLRRS